MQNEATDPEIHHRLDVRANHLAARLPIAIFNLLLALYFSPALFFGSIYLFGPVADPPFWMNKGWLVLLFVTLGCLVVVVFATTTAIVALRKGYWRLKYQLLCLAGVAAMVLSESPTERGTGGRREVDPLEILEIRDAGGSAEFTQLLQEIDTAVEASKKSASEAWPLFDKLVADVHNLGLATVREQQKEVAQKVTDLFGKSVEQKRLAAKKSEEAAQKEPREKFKPFFTHKAQSYEFYAQVLAINQEIVRLVFDESIVKVEDLMSKVEEAEKRRLAVGKSGNQAEAKANAIAKEMKDNPK